MILRKLKGFTRLRLSLGVALCALFVFVASASAVVYVYKNSFGSKSAYNEIDKISGGKKCERTYVKDNTGCGSTCAGRPSASTRRRS